MRLALAAALLALAVPAQAGPYLASNGAAVRVGAGPAGIEVTGARRNGGADVYYCAAAEAARARLGASVSQRIRIEGMPRAGQGALFTLLPADPDRAFGAQILGRRGSSLSIGAAIASCRPI